MHTFRGLERLMNSQEGYGGSGGSCFGVTDPKRLRDPFRHAAIPTLLQYTITFQDNRPPHIFEARNVGEALHIAADVLEIRGKLDRKKFWRAGAKEVLCGDRTVFPKEKLSKKKKKK